jgi:peptidoglycan/LPS O-acetylase OafA/YrhL
MPNNQMERLNNTVIFAGIDTTRTILALLVAIGHFFLWNGVTNQIPSSFFLAVDFFFVISGFVLMQKVLLSPNVNFDYFFKNFLCSRLYRLFPLYLITFILSIFLLIIQFGMHFDAFYYVFISLFLFHAMGFKTDAQHLFADTSIGIGWSISVELWMGLIFFSFAYLLRNKKTYLLIFLTCMALLSALLMTNFSPNLMNVNLQRMGNLITFGAIRGLEGFAIGAISFLLYHNVRKTFHLNVVTIFECIFFAIPVLLFVKFSYDRQNEFVAPFLFAPIVIAIALNQGLISRFLSMNFWNPIRPLSYSIYLIHPLLILIYRKLSLQFNVANGLIYLLLLIFFSLISSKFLEKPFILFGKKRS